MMTTGITRHGSVALHTRFLFSTVIGIRDQPQEVSGAAVVGAHTSEPDSGLTPDV